MRPSTALLLAALLVTGCARAPSAVEPTLAAVEALGTTCGDGVPDNVPSGLVEWRCVAADHGDAAGALIQDVTVDGNDHGVARIVLALDPDLEVASGQGASSGAEQVRAALALVVERVPPLSAAPALKDGLGDWSGEEVATEIGNARILARCFEGRSCSLEIGPAGNPIEPLQLP